eukprot:305687-Heterocapsa_arctica.AAC.1
MQMQEERPSRRRAFMEPVARFIASSRTTANQKGVWLAMVSGRGKGPLKQDMRSSTSIAHSVLSALT